jgi:hypothetical protein
MRPVTAKHLACRREPPGSSRSAPLCDRRAARAAAAEARAQRRPSQPPNHGSGGGGATNAEQYAGKACDEIGGPGPTRGSAWRPITSGGVRSRLLRASEAAFRDRRDRRPLGTSNGSAGSRPLLFHQKDQPREPRPYGWRTAASDEWRTRAAVALRQAARDDSRRRAAAAGHCRPIAPPEPRGSARYRWEWIGAVVVSDTATAAVRRGCRISRSSTGVASSTSE